MGEGQDHTEDKIPVVNEDDITILHYDSVIDSGAFGKVYEGRYQGTPAAVKKIPIEELSDRQEVLLRRLSHPHIVNIMAVSTKRHNMIIAYEHIHGANLDKVIHKSCDIELNEEEKMCVALGVAMAFEYIHEKSVIHQDIKPENILVSERSKKAYLTDWGLAMKHSGEFGVSASHSLCGPKFAGTLMYMAPELILENKCCSTMSDMWSLGLTYLEMFTGSEPWNLKNPRELTKALFKQERPHALAELQLQFTEIVEPLVQYEPQSRMTATGLVTCLKSVVRKYR